MKNRLFGIIITGLLLVVLAGYIYSADKDNNQAGKDNGKPNPPAAPDNIPQFTPISATPAVLAKIPLKELYTRFVDLSSREIIDFSILMERLKNTQVVYVAESHTSKEQHLLQLVILETLYKNNKKVALGMEFLHRPVQSYVDNYIADKLSEKELLPYIKEGFGDWYNLYRSLLQFAAKNDVKTVALNTSKEVREKFINSGWDSLSDEQKKYIAKDIDTSDKTHREYVLSQFGGMMRSGVMKQEQMDRFYLGQCIWDETMAESIANYLKKANDPAVQMVIVAGRAHVEYKFNIPNRAYKRYKMKFKTIVPIELNNIDDIDFKALLSSKIGDFVAFTPVAPPR